TTRVTHRVMRFQSRVSLAGTTGWMITTLPVFSSGPELKYVLLWNGTLILAAIGFSASSSAFSLLSDVWAKHRVAATKMVAVTQRQPDRRECIAHQPFRTPSERSGASAIRVCRGILQPRCRRASAVRPRRRSDPDRRR